MKCIHEFVDAEKSLQSIITDGGTTCCYQDIPIVFESIKQYLASQGVGRGDCLAVELENSVNAAILLLFLLENGYSFLALPKTPPVAAKDEEVLSYPAFCKYRIIPEVNPNEQKKLFNAESWLQVFPNKTWNGNPLCPGFLEKLLLKTSGSTGAPKMAVIPHAGLRGNAQNTMDRLKITHEDRVALPVPIFHSFGLTTAFLSCVAAGASVDLQKGANLLRYFQREREFDPNVAFTTPVFCETLVKGRRSNRLYRLTVAAGDRFRGETFLRYEERCGCLVNLYGSTEFGAIAAASPDDPADVRSQCAGKPMSGIEVRILERTPESMDELKGLGEIWCRSPYRFDKYVDNQGEDVHTDQIGPDGWFCTKDLGRIRPDGSIEVFGRSDHSVNRDGLLVFFADVEKKIGSISGVESVVVVSIGVTNRGKGMAAYCTLKKGLKLTPEAVRQTCFELLPRRAVPDHIILMDTLPLMPNGKIDRMKLTRMAESEKI
ncbi:MAG: fatty acid--CoA ligase family protein [Desulfosalsimonadaceae bacterium]|nr:fatty acid--CoA ligase family protein [Desulfosalsimonadaceae bacterium]